MMPNVTRFYRFLNLIEVFSVKQVFMGMAFVVKTLLLSIYYSGNPYKVLTTVKILQGFHILGTEDTVSNLQRTAFC